MTTRNGQSGLTLGDILAGAGALLLLVSLWQPWYEVRIPDMVLDQARAFSSRMGELAPYAQQGIDRLQSEGPISVTAWQVFEQADTMLAVTAGLALGLVALTAIGALSVRLDGPLVAAGVLATAVVVFRIASPPGPGASVGSDFLFVATGAYLALAGALLMAAGGIVAAMGQGMRTPPPPPTPAIPAHEIKVWDAS